VDRPLSESALVAMLQYGLLYYAACDVAARPSVQPWIPRLFIAAAAAGGLGALLALAGILVQPTVATTIPASGIPRLCFGMPDANEQAMLFLFALAFLLFSPGLWQGLRRRALSASAFAAIAAGMVLTMSRTGWLCTGLLILARVGIARNRGRSMTALVACALVAGLILAFANSRCSATRR
jgi:hypothetical protein